MTEPREKTKTLEEHSMTDNTVMEDDDCRGLDRGWSWIVMAASFGGFCLIGGTMYAVGIIHSTLLEQFHENVATTSWAGALHSALISAGGPLSSLVIDRVSCRLAIILSGICYVIGYFCTAFAPNIGVAIFTCGIIAGLGGAFGYTACMVVVGFNFRRHRNIALGVALSGVGVGMFAMAPVMQISRTYYGTSGFFLVLAAVAANIITCGVLCFPSELEISAHRKRKLEKLKRNEKSASCATLRGYAQVALNKPVLCLCLCMFNYCLGTFLIYLHLPQYVIHKGFTSTEASYFVSVSGITSVIGRVLTGITASLKTLPDISFYSGSMGIVSIATFLLPLYSGHFAGNMVYAVILGLFFGSCYVVTASITIRYIGIHYMSAAIGLQMFFGGIGALIGPVLAGIIVDSGGSYDQSFVVAGFCILLACLLSASSHYFYRHSSRKKPVYGDGDTELVVQESLKVIPDDDFQESLKVVPENDVQDIQHSSTKPIENGYHADDSS